MPQSGNSPIPLGIKEIKRELWKQAFRELFPQWKSQIDKFLSNPNCECNRSLLLAILDQKPKLEAYFGGPVQLLVNVSKDQNQRVVVINTSVHNLESELRKLPMGPKYISLARFQNEITAVIQLLN